MFDVLQSSYADVEHEMQVMTAWAREEGSQQIIFMAGDGLAIMRLNHILANKPDMYIDMAPLVIPIQGIVFWRCARICQPRLTGPRVLYICIVSGEHPHGLFHAMHCHWRLNRQFIMWCANVVENKQVIEDPNVSVFNTHRYFFLNVLTRACAEYINFIAGTAGAETVDDPVGFVAKADSNLDFAWVCHFAYDAGFFILDFLQSVRGNESRTLDLLWREFFASAHSGTANKTQYVPMAIMRVFWGMALTPELQELYHKIRTLPNSDELGSGVGWDMAIEMLNAAIKAHVAHRVSEVQICNFIRSWALLECVQKQFREFIYAGRAKTSGSHAIDATADVKKLVMKFKEVIGSTWAAATTPNEVSHVTLGPQRQVLPWVEVADVMARQGDQAPAAFIRAHVSQLTPFFEWK